MLSNLRLGTRRNGWPASKSVPVFFRHNRIYMSDPPRFLHSVSFHAVGTCTGKNSIWYALELRDTRDDPVLFSITQNSCAFIYVLSCSTKTESKRPGNMYEKQLSPLVSHAFVVGGNPIVVVWSMVSNGVYIMRINGIVVLLFVEFARETLNGGIPEMIECVPLRFI